MATKKTDTQALSSREVAEALNTTPRELRVFLRASDDYTAVGAGSRYVFATADIAALKTRFAAWGKVRAAKAAEARAAREQADA